MSLIEEFVKPGLEILKVQKSKIDILEDILKIGEDVDSENKKKFESKQYVLNPFI